MDILVQVGKLVVLNSVLRTCLILMVLTHNKLFRCFRISQG